MVFFRFPFGFLSVRLVIRLVVGVCWWSGGGRLVGRLARLLVGDWWQWAGVGFVCFFFCVSLRSYLFFYLSAYLPFLCCSAYCFTFRLSVVLPSVLPVVLPSVYLLVYLLFYLLFLCCFSVVRFSVGLPIVLPSVPLLFCLPLSCCFLYSFTLRLPVV